MIFFQPLLELAFDPGAGPAADRGQVRTDTGFSASGTLPSAMRSARPSTRAVLAHARLTDEDRVVFSPTGENIHHLADFRVASGTRVNLAVSGFWR